MYIPQLFETLSPDLHLERIAQAERHQAANAPKAWTSVLPAYRRLLPFSVGIRPLRSVD